MHKALIFSHGFGVQADARGMFTDIAAAFPDYTSVMFDYNEILPSGDTVAAPLDVQASKLQDVINETEADEITLICHSQGTLIAGLVGLAAVAKVVLLAPPGQTGMQRVIDKLAVRAGGEFNPDGLSKLPRSDGSTTLLPRSYLESLDLVKPVSLYQKVANTAPTVIIRATQDEVVGPTNLDAVTAATIVDIPADHDFSGAARQTLIRELKDVI